MSDEHSTEGNREQAGFAEVGRDLRNFTQFVAMKDAYASVRDVGDWNALETQARRLQLSYSHFMGNQLDIFSVKGQPSPIKSAETMQQETVLV